MLQSIVLDRTWFRKYKLAPALGTGQVPAPILGLGPVSKQWTEAFMDKSIYLHVIHFGVFGVIGGLEIIHNDQRACICCIWKGAYKILPYLRRVYDRGPATGFPPREKGRPPTAKKGKAKDMKDI